MRKDEGKMMEYEDDAKEIQWDLKGFDDEITAFLEQMGKSQFDYIFEE